MEVPMMKHKVKVKVARVGSEPTTVLESRCKRILGRFARFLFGDYAEVLVLKPGKTVQTVEICELKEEKDA